MGAHSFVRIGHGATAEAVYRRLCEEAVHQDGHSSYSGSIGTTKGFFLATQDVLPERAAQKIANDLIAQDDPRLDKWGDCGCIAIAKDSHFAPRTVTVTFEATPGLFDHRGTLSHKKLASSLIASTRDQQKMRDGEQFLGYHINKVVPTLRGSVKTSVGKAVTRYVIVEQLSDTPQFDLQNVTAAFAKGHQSKAEAARTLRTIVKTPPTRFEAPQRHFEIIGLILSENGAGIVRGKREVLRQKVTASVHLYTPNPKATATSWLFFGWAAA